MNICLTNEEIYKTFYKLQNFSTERISIALFFAISKNKAILFSLIKEIEEFRILILSKYGKFSEQNQNYEIPTCYLEIVNNELKQLSLLTQSVNIVSINPTDLIGLTIDQVQNLDFMVKKEE